MNMQDKKNAPKVAKTIAFTYETGDAPFRACIPGKESDVSDAGILKHCLKKENRILPLAFMEKNGAKISTAEDKTLLDTLLTKGVLKVNHKVFTPAKATADILPDTWSTTFPDGKAVTDAFVVWMKELIAAKPAEEKPAKGDEPQDGGNKTGGKRTNKEHKNDAAGAQPTREELLAKIARLETQHVSASKRSVFQTVDIVIEDPEASLANTERMNEILSKKNVSQKMLSHVGRFNNLMLRVVDVMRTNDSVNPGICSVPLQAKLVELFHRGSSAFGFSRLAPFKKAYEDLMETSQVMMGQVEVEIEKEGYLPIALVHFTADWTSLFLVSRVDNVETLEYIRAVTFEVLRWTTIPSVDEICGAWGSEASVNQMKARANASSFVARRHPHLNACITGSEAGEGRTTPDRPIEAEYPATLAKVATFLSMMEGKGGRIPRPLDHSKVTCYNCDEKGHHADACKKPKDEAKIAAAIAKAQEARKRKRKE